MRILFSTTGGTGHLIPLLPFAAACRDAGHEVRIATQRARAPVVERAGFTPAPFDDPPEAAWLAARGEIARMPMEQANARMTRDVFYGINARAALPGLLATMETWAPDVVAFEPAEPAAPLAAERYGIPSVCVTYILAATASWARPFAAVAADALRGAACLEPDPGGERIRATPSLTATPPSLDAGSDEAAPHRFRTEAATDGAPLPDWWPGNRDPLVYVTFGSVASELPPFASLFRDAIAALTPLRARLLVTTGKDFDPASLGPLPPNVHAERWVPQADVLGHAAVMVGHGGYGTTLGALAHGVPQAILPLFAIDQHFNARSVAAAGAGIALDGAPRMAFQPPGSDLLAALPGAVERLLADASFAAAAGRVAEEMAWLPPVADSVPMLEALAGARV